MGQQGSTIMVNGIPHTINRTDTMKGEDPTIASARAEGVASGGKNLLYSMKMQEMDKRAVMLPSARPQYALENSRPSRIAPIYYTTNPDPVRDALMKEARASGYKNEIDAQTAILAGYGRSISSSGNIIAARQSGIPAIERNAKFYSRDKRNTDFSPRSQRDNYNSNMSIGVITKGEAWMIIAVKGAIAGAVGGLVAPYLVSGTNNQISTKMGNMKAQWAIGLTVGAATVLGDVGYLYLPEDKKAYWQGMLMNMAQPAIAGVAAGALGYAVVGTSGFEGIAKFAVIGAGSAALSGYIGSKFLDPIAMSR